MLSDVTSTGATGAFDRMKEKVPIPPQSPGLVSNDKRDPGCLGMFRVYPPWN